MDAESERGLPTLDTGIEQSSREERVSKNSSQRRNGAGMDEHGACV